MITMFNGQSIFSTWIFQVENTYNRKLPLRIFPIVVWSPPEYNKLIPNRCLLFDYIFNSKFKLKEISCSKNWLKNGNWLIFPNYYPVISSWEFQVENSALFLADKKMGDFELVMFLKFYLDSQLENRQLENFVDSQPPENSKKNHLRYKLLREMTKDWKSLKIAWILVEV